MYLQVASSLAQVTASSQLDKKLSLTKGREPPRRNDSQCPRITWGRTISVDGVSHAHSRLQQKSLGLPLQKLAVFWRGHLKLRLLGGPKLEQSMDLPAKLEPVSVLNLAAVGFLEQSAAGLDSLTVGKAHMAGKKSLFGGPKDAAKSRPTTTAWHV